MQPAPPPVAVTPPSPPRPALTAPALRAATLARFVDPLPVPKLLKPMGTRPDPRDPGQAIPFHRALMTEAAVKVHRDLPLTRVWTYEGSFPGPTIEARRGQPIQVEWINALPPHVFLAAAAPTGDPATQGGRAVVHLHGGRVPPDSDGGPGDAFAPGTSRTVVYPNAQDAATLWYHDGALATAPLNQYAGLMGVYLVRDPGEASLGLPDGAHELPLVLCDRSFGQDGQLREPRAGDASAESDAHLVNGKLFPYLDVEPRRYRLRVVNGSNARAYDLSFGAGVAIHQIGTDQGLLGAPVPLSTLTLAPGERGDLIVDFARAAGRAVLLSSGDLQLMQVRVAPGRPPRQRPLPRRLADLPRPQPAAADASRTMILSELPDPAAGRPRFLVSGKRWDDPVTERPRLGSTEVWTLVNQTRTAQPIHLHLVRFRVLGPDATGAEAGWKDTVRVGPGTTVRLLVSFEGYTGRYLWHSQVAADAARGLMRPFEVVAPPT